MGTDPSTFLVDPDEEEFEAWQTSLNLESQQDHIDALLTNNEKLRKLFEEMVPSKVWQEKCQSLCPEKYLLFEYLPGSGINILGSISVSNSHGQRKRDKETANSKRSTNK